MPSTTPIGPTGSEPITVSVFGSSGSIGTQTLDVIRANPDRYRVQVLGTRSNMDVLRAQVNEFRPQIVAVADHRRVAEIRDTLPVGTELVVGPQAFEEVAGQADVAVNGVVGFAGLGVTIGALAAGKRLALANKESLITAGPVVAPFRSTPGAEILPVDSEHAAIHMCLAAHRTSQSADLPDRVQRLVLTASGGPFRNRDRATLKDVTVSEALAHPTWAMGPKITIDSSTLMNKGFEVIEAHELFGVEYDRIEVVVHPQSVIHSMVEYTDGATMAQLSMPDMCLPIAYALAWPDRSTTAFGSIDWATLSRLDFEAPDRAAFKCLDLAYEAGRRGNTAPAWLNAANEIAVEAFLAGRITWGQIAEINEAVLDQCDGFVPTSVGDIIEADRLARVVAVELSKHTKQTTHFKQTTHSKHTTRTTQQGPHS
jgi:1-deoxy-D-xylulose-5-phosphate reductoisomerase